MDLKDLFAAHVAGALAARTERPPRELAARAYDLAEALVVERQRRIDRIEAEESSIRYDFAAEEASLWHVGLLDEPAPYSESERDELPASWLDKEQEPAWDAEPKWAPDASVAAEEESAKPELRRSDRPGLARTQPEAQTDLAIASGDDTKRR
ncbi:MAG: hypothetical protein U0271_16885 [Polyangiaceae bacterium]